ncbi:MAG: hypothetical protein NUV60_03540 [Patescibacteria group bacterium]|nr:hypothetical protein [Patescibacteria group bacterium]
MRTYPFLFLDLETTGHDPLKRVDDTLIPWHEIIDMGWVLADSKTLQCIEEGEIKIRSEHPERCLPDLINHYPARAARGEWNTAVSLTDGLRMFLNFVTWYVAPGVAVLRGQNFFFDWNFLSTAFAWNNISQEELQTKYFHYARLDNRSMAVQELLVPNEPFEPADYSMRNSHLLRTLNIEPEPAVHTAINGARKAYEVAVALDRVKRAR